MECTTVIKIIDLDQNSIKSFHQLMSGNKPIEAESIKKYFSDHKQIVNIESPFVTDSYESSKIAIDFSFISSSTTPKDFIVPLSKIFSYVLGSIHNDEDGPAERYASIQGKKVTLSEFMLTVANIAPLNDLCSTGRHLLEQREAEANPAISVLNAVMQKKSLEKIAELIKTGGDVNAKDRYGETSLARAISRKDAKLVELLLQNNASTIAPKGKQTYLIEACRFGSKKCVSLLLHYKADPNEMRNNDYWSALECAINNCMPESIMELIKHGARTSGKKYISALVNHAMTNTGRASWSTRKKTLTVLLQDKNFRKELISHREKYIEEAINHCRKFHGRTTSEWPLPTSEQAELDKYIQIIQEA